MRSLFRICPPPWKKHVKVNFKYLFNIKRPCQKDANFLMLFGIRPFKIFAYNPKLPHHFLKSWLAQCFEPYISCSVSLQWAFQFRKEEGGIKKGKGRESEFILNKRPLSAWIRHHSPVRIKLIGYNCFGTRVADTDRKVSWLLFQLVEVGWERGGRTGCFYLSCYETLVVLKIIMYHTGGRRNYCGCQAHKCKYVFFVAIIDVFWFFFINK